MAITAITNSSARSAPVKANGVACCAKGTAVCVWDAAEEVGAIPGVDAIPVVGAWHPT
jgi:hypothetical protein